MKDHRSLTQSMSWLHTWSGLLIGWLLFAIFFTGTLAVFDRELNWWMQPELVDRQTDQTTAASVAQRWLQSEYPDAQRWNIGLPTEREPQLSVSAGEQRRGQRTLLDPQTGEVIAPRETVGGSFFFRFHHSLQLPRTIGIWLVGFAGMAMLVGIISGVIIHKKIFKDFFTFRPAKGQRTWLDGHAATAVLLLPFHLMITYTGLAIFAQVYMPAASEVLYDGDRQAMMRDVRGGGERGAEQGGNPGANAGGEQRGAPGNGQRSGARAEASAPAATAQLLPLDTFIGRGEAFYGEGLVNSLTVINPGRANAQVEVSPVLGSRIELTKGEHLTYNGVTGEAIDLPEPSRPSKLTQRVIAGLHFAQFGGYGMRWLYFVSGLVSCALIASGLVIYTVKRRRQSKPGSTEGKAFLRLVESLNTAAVSGLVLASVFLLWANRLLPQGLAERELWEMRLFFGCWLLSLLHARLREPFRAWREQLYAITVLGLALPLLNVLIGEGYIDATRVVVDATTVGLALLAGWAAMKVRRQQLVGNTVIRRKPRVMATEAPR